MHLGCAAEFSCKLEYPDPSRWQLKLLQQLHPFLQKSDLVMTIHVFVIFSLDFYDALLRLPLESVWNLQGAQNPAARLCIGASYNQKRNSSLQLLTVHL